MSLHITSFLFLFLFYGKCEWNFVELVISPSLPLSAVSHYPTSKFALSCRSGSAPTKNLAWRGSALKAFLAQTTFSLSPLDRLSCSPRLYCPPAQSVAQRDPKKNTRARHQHERRHGRQSPVLRTSHPSLQLFARCQLCCSEDQVESACLSAWSQAKQHRDFRL